MYSKPYSCTNILGKSNVVIPHIHAVILQIHAAIFYKSKTDLNNAVRFDFAFRVASKG